MQEIEDELAELAKQDLEAKTRLAALERVSIEIDMLERRRGKIRERIFQLIEEGRIHA
jgi:hypothetical protein